MSERTALYRHFDADGKLLYVGISLSAVGRLAQHRRGARWANRIASVTVEQFPSREAAAAAERLAIQTEHPECNIMHSRPQYVSPTPTPTEPRATNTMLGLYGHTHEDDGEINWQFEIVRDLGDNTYLAQLYSWMDGRPTKLIPMTLSDIIDGGHSLYSTEEEWRAAANASARKYRDIRRRQLHSAAIRPIVQNM